MCSVAFMFIHDADPLQPCQGCYARYAAHGSSRGLPGSLCLVEIIFISYMSTQRVTVLSPDGKLLAVTGERDVNVNIMVCLCELKFVL